MPGIQLFQANGVGTVNAIGDEHPSPIEIEVGLLCKVTPVGILSATWRWVFSKPSSSGSVLSSATGAGPSFLPDVENGSYSIRLYDDDENEYILDIVTPTSGAGGGGAAGGSVVTTVDTYDDFRNNLAFSGTPSTAFIVQCRETVDDGGGGLFAYDASDTISEDNDGTVLVDLAGNRVKRIFDGPVHIKWFGAREDEDDNSAAIQAALDASTNVYVDEGEFSYSTRLDVADGTRIDGAGRGAVLVYEGDGTAMRYENPTGTRTAQMVWSSFSIRSGSPSSKIGIELVNAYNVTLSNVEVDGENNGFDHCGIRVTSAFGAFNSAVINIQDGTRVHECFGDGIQAYYPPDIACTFNAATNFVTANAHGKLEGDLVLFGTDGSLVGTGVTGGVQDFYFVRNPTTNTFQVSVTPTGATVDLLGAGTGSHKIVGPGAPVGGLTVTGCTIDQCENGINSDAGTLGTAGELSVLNTLLQSNRRCQITGSFLRSAIRDSHMEQGGAALTGGAHILMGASQNVYALVIENNLISGIVDGQDYSIDISPGGATRRDVFIGKNFLNRAAQYNIRVGGVQGVGIDVNYYGNYQLGTVTLSSCTGVRIQTDDYGIDTMSVRRVVTDNATADALDELIQVNGANKTVTLPGADAFSAYGGKRYTVFNLLNTTTTVDLTSSDTVDGSGQFSVVGQYTSATFVAITPDSGVTFQWAVLAHRNGPLAGPLLRGSGTPEGAISAPVGTLFERTDGASGTTVYVKASGAGDTGWEAVSSLASGRRVTVGTLTPEGAVTGVVGDMFLRSDGGTSEALYVKVSGAGDTGWENVFTDPYEVQLTRLHRGTPTFGDPTLWSVDENGRVICQTTAGDFAVFNLDLPDGVTLDTLELTVIGGGNVSLPAAMPRFRLRRHTITTDTAVASSFEIDASGTVGAYNAIHTITMTGLALSVANNTRFGIEFVSESGANAVTGFAIIGIKATMTTRLSQLDRGSA